MWEGCHYLTFIAIELYDYTKEPARPSAFREVPLAPRPVIEVGVDGMTDGFHDQLLISCQFAVLRDDVLPRFFGQHDCSAVWFEDLTSDSSGRHRPIVSSATQGSNESP